jgi:hypothetical protein
MEKTRRVSTVQSVYSIVLSISFFLLFVFFGYSLNIVNYRAVDDK